MLKLKLTQRPPTAAKIMKQFRFGAATGLTKTATEGQSAVVGAAKGAFNVRGRWFEKGMRYGIKIQRATPSKLTATVQTRAGWLKKQQIGGNVTAGQKARVFPYEYNGQTYIAIPSKALRPRGSKKLIWPRKLWPSNLKKPFVIKDKKGRLLLMTRFMEGKQGVEVMYILVPDVDIKKVDTWQKPLDTVIKRRLSLNIGEGIEKAFATMKP